MRVYLGLAMAIVFGLAGVLTAAPLNLEQVPADAKWVAHLDVDAMRASSMAGKAQEHWKQQHPEAEKHLERIREIWHFNPCEDLHGVTIYGTQMKRDNGAAIVHAKVDQEVLLEMARKAPGHQETAYGRYQLHTWKHAEGKRRSPEMTGVFFRPDVLVFGPTVDEVKAALDVLDGKTANLAGKESPLAGAVPPGTMFLARAAGIADAEKLPGMSPMAKQIDTLTMAAGESEGDCFFTGKMTMKKAEFAENMKTMIEGVRAMATMAQNGSDPEAMKIINALKVSVEGNAVIVEWRVSAEEVWKHMQKMEEKMRKDFMSMPMQFGPGFGGMPGPDEDEDF